MYTKENLALPPAARVGGETLCVTSWSINTTRPGRGRTVAPMPESTSMKCVSPPQSFSFHPEFT